jgi:hypothetical protein
MEESDLRKKKADTLYLTYETVPTTKKGKPLLDEYGKPIMKRMFYHSYLLNEKYDYALFITDFAHTTMVDQTSLRDCLQDNRLLTELIEGKYSKDPVEPWNRPPSWRFRIDDLKKSMLPDLPLTYKDECADFLSRIIELQIEPSKVPPIVTACLFQTNYEGRAYVIEDYDRLITTLIKARESKSRLDADRQQEVEKAISTLTKKHILLDYKKIPQKEFTCFRDVRNYFTNLFETNSPKYTWFRFIKPPFYAYGNFRHSVSEMFVDPRWFTLDVKRRKVQSQLVILQEKSNGMFQPPRVVQPSSGSLSLSSSSPALPQPTYFDELDGFDERIIPDPEISPRKLTKRNGSPKGKPTKTYKKSKTRLCVL